ncbi:MAG: Dna2/Cas4 domain-containing protein, partial [Desulfosporosinus sp.]
KGELLFPKEKRKEEVELTSELERELDVAALEIEKIAQQDTPPLLRKIPLCRNCAYKEFCWA